MKLSDLDEMLQNRRELVEMRSEMHDLYGPVSALPKSIKLAVTVDLMERSKADLLDIDGRLVEWGVEIDMPHEQEPDAEEDDAE